MTTTRRAALKLGLIALAAPLAATMAQAAGHAEHVVEIRGMSFTPSVLEIKAGETVRFENLGPAPHTATADDGSFDTGRLARNESIEITFDTAGTFDYFCEIHPRMRASLIVR